ncbi:hypothetical protein ACHAW5_003329 [Stephanodiscus triporus]|uniref:Uncharacterized protein n=1 Tax=Stephanodiscus triporus TaxID=2934178 RepID=A0ABD3QHX8_9STRA
MAPRRGRRISLAASSAAREDDDDDYDDDYDESPPSSSSNDVVNRLLRERARRQEGQYARLFAMAAARGGAGGGGGGSPSSVVPPESVRLILFHPDAPEQRVHAIQYPMGSSCNWILAFEDGEDCVDFVRALPAETMFEPFARHCERLVEDESRNLDDRL